MNIPEDLKYTKNDEWVRVDGKIGTIGITDFAQDQLSDIVYVEFSVGEDDDVSKGVEIAAVESVKAAADVYLPIGGIITALNNNLEDTPEMINTDPYGQAWMLKVEIADLSELDDLMDSEAYSQYCEEREH